MVLVVGGGVAGYFASISVMGDGAAGTVSVRKLYKNVPLLQVVPTPGQG